MSKITITKEGIQWIARFPWDVVTKDTVKAAGFRFDGTRRLWYTTDPTVAGRLDANAAAAANNAVAASRATDARVDIPAPAGLSYLPYQRAGIAYALGKDAVLIADEMGLGKTIEAIGIINADPSIKSVLVVCPASLKINWSRELAKWLTRPMTVGIANGALPATDVVIINYDILAKFRPAIDARSWDLLVADESHYAKNPKAQRTIALLGKKDRRDPSKSKSGIAARRRVFMTGTPIVNRPVELWPLVEALDPADMGRNFFSFAKRYTAAEHNGYGWDFSGAANLDELQQRLRAKFMVRRLKSEVLTELPAKRRQIIVLPTPSGAAGTAVAEERALFEAHRVAIETANREFNAARARGDKDGWEAAIRKLHAANSIAFTEMSRVRHQTAIAKIPLVIEHVTEVLEAEPKVVVFSHHLDVAHAVRDAFPGAAMVTGDLSPNAKQAEVDRFCSDPACRVMIGTYPGALGTGHTLVVAKVAVFAELDWVPGNVSQAEDRLHRIGQDDKVLIQHLVFDRSVDSLMAGIIVEKQEIFDQAMDRRGPQIEAAVQAPEPAPDLFTPAKTAGNGYSNPAIPFDAEVPF